MYKITFKYKDQYSHGNWNTQTCKVQNINECIRIYGLGVNCEYEILEIKDLEGE